ncbi:MAG: alanine racemase [Desulfobulbaceae bacterium]|nr:alanine racemase [Desulfobulbaceae bacterium]
MNNNSFNCIKINCTALQNNYTIIKKKAGSNIPVMAMVKADGYGHGMVMAAKAFSGVGCTTFGVAELREAVLLRQAGIAGDIYVTIGFAQEDVGLIFQYELIPVIYSYEAAQVLSSKAVALGVEIGVHIKVDSGMGRLGIFPTDMSTFLDTVSGLPGIKIAGIMSHFAESDNPVSKSTVQSFKSFADASRELKNRFEGISHIANSGAVLNFPDTYCDMVRVGIALYGYHPAGRVGRDDRDAENLIPAMSFVSRILQVKTVPAGTGISYGHTWQTKKQTRFAVLPVGYEDGYSRGLSNRGQVLVHGHRVPVLGRICMNMCMVDVSDLTLVKAGDEVVLLGQQGQDNITADEIAEEMGSISYEVLCLLGNNNQRVYIE